MIQIQVHDDHGFRLNCTCLLQIYDYKPGHVNAKQSRYNTYKII